MPHAFPLAALLALALPAAPVAAQTGYYNLDGGRPVRVEDAHVTERYTLELEPLPLRAERIANGVYRFIAEPHLAYGLLPRTQVEFGVPLEMRDASGRRQSGIVGIDVSGMHNFNNESRFVPALALWLGARLPVGALAAEGARIGARGLMTRTFSAGRVHLNAEYSTSTQTTSCTTAPNSTVCDSFDDGHICFRATPVNASCRAALPATRVAAAETGTTSQKGRWAGGIAVDRAFPLRSMLVVASLFADREAASDAPTELTAEAGVRWQLGPSSVLDAGIGRHFTGTDRSWFITSGLAFELGLIPFGGRE